MSTYVLVCLCVSVCGMYVMLCYVMLFYYIYIYIRVCMPALAQEGGGEDAGGDGGLGWVGREGGETEQNVI